VLLTPVAHHTSTLLTESNPIPGGKNHITLYYNHITSKGKESKQRFKTLQIDDAWSKKRNYINLTFRVLQHTSSEVTVTTITKTYKLKIEPRHW